MLPSSVSIVPRTRVACCAKAEDIASATIAAAGKIRLAAWFMCLSQNAVRAVRNSAHHRSDAAASHRRRHVLAVGNARDVERAVGKLRRVGDEDPLAYL